MTNPDAPANCADARTMAATQAAYADVKGIQRQLSADDRLREDLDVDSLDAIEILSILEDSLGVSLIEEATTRMEGLVTFGDFLRVIYEVQVSSKT